MHPCPHCQQPTFSTARKVLLLWLGPGLCSACNKPAFIPLRNVAIAVFAWVVLSWLLIATTFYMRNVLFLLGSIPAAMLAIDLWLVRAPLAGDLDDDIQH